MPPCCSKNWGVARCLARIFASGVLGALTVLHGGTEAQKQAILPQVARGEQVLSLAVTEPIMAGARRRVQMHASLERGHYVLNGVKAVRARRQAATHLICAVRTRRPANGASKRYLPCWSSMPEPLA